MPANRRLPAAMRLVVLSVAVPAAIAISAPNQRAYAQRGDRPAGYSPHEGPPTDPWMPNDGATAGESSGIEHCGPWVRDGFVSVQVNVNKRGCNIVGDAANEPSIAIDPTNPRKIAIGWRQFDTVESNFRQAGWGYSHDAGHTWSFPGVLDPGVFGSDPVLASDADGGFYYLTISLDDMRLFRSFDGGLSWPARTQVVPSVLDKPWIAIDTTNGIGRGNVYIAGQGRFFRSTDGGASFDEHFPSIGSFPTLSVDRLGRLFILDGSGGVLRSDNAGDPDQNPIFGPRVEAIPGAVSRSDPPNPRGLAGQYWISTDHSDGATRDNVYVLGTVEGDALDLVFLRSTDGGLTWDHFIRLNDDPFGNGAYQWFGMMSVAPNGRIDAAWNDTRNTGEPNLSELFYSYSADAGETWSKNIPVSPVFDTWVGWPQQNKIGDYYHMLSDNLGVNVAYAATFNNEQDVYFLRIGPWDCNGNEVPDEQDIENRSSLDCNDNAVPDECEYRGDRDGDGRTTARDYRRFVDCFTGPTAKRVRLCCRLFDIEPDGDVDLWDFAYLQRAFSGP